MRRTAPTPQPTRTLPRAAGRTTLSACGGGHTRPAPRALEVGDGRDATDEAPDVLERAFMRLRAMRRGRVLEHDRQEARVQRVPGGRVDAYVRRHAREDERGRAARAQVQLQRGLDQTRVP